MSFIWIYVELMGERVEERAFIAQALQGNTNNVYLAS